jgi:hypothetical protein
MDNSDASNSPTRVTGGFSLATLALLVTVCAVILTSVDIHRCQEQLSKFWETDQGFVVVVFALAGLVGGLIGFFRVIIDDFTWPMLFAAMVGGTLAGLAAVLILVAPGPLWRSLLAIGLLLATTNILRLGSE